jgi:hypothetical protein
MSFTAITTGEIASGEPTSMTTQTKIKDNFDNHESRLQSLESANTGDPPIILRVNGNYSEAGALNSVLKTTTNLSLNITGVRILIDQAGSAGTTQIDLKRSRAGGAYTTIFTTKPSVSYTAGNDALSTNAVLDASMQSFIAGDILRLDITGVQTGALSFLVRIDFNRG